MDLVAALPRIVSVFALAFVSFWTSIPAGFALGLAPIVVAATAWLSYSAGVALVVVAGQPIRKWIASRLGNKVAANPDSTIRRVWERYGLVGFALLAPMTTGAQIGALLALSLGVPPRRILLAMSIGAALWAVLITGGIALGVTGAQAIH
jgi:uncharacterized membrane protein